MRHKLRHNKRSGAPSLFVSIATETSQIDHCGNDNYRYERLRWVCATRFRLERGKVTRRENAVFSDGAALWAWVAAGLDTHKRTWLFSHRAGFDLLATQFWDRLADGDFAPSVKRRGPGGGDELGDDKQAADGLLVTDDPPTILDLQSKQGRSLVIVDVRNFFDCKLEELGAAIGVPRVPQLGDEAEDGARVERTWNEAMIVGAAAAKLIGFVRSDDLGNLRYTMGGQAMALYRHRCMTTEISLGHEQYLREFERESFYGARCRAYFIGAVVPPGTAPFWVWPAKHNHYALNPSGPVYRLDVNGHYPSVMTGNDYPVSYLNSGNEITSYDLLSILKTSEAVADVSLSSPCVPFPRREKIFPRYGVGQFGTVLCGPDLRRALNGGFVRRVWRWQAYERGRPFDRFVEVTQEMKGRYRDSGDALLERAAKFLGNSLFGKFTQRANRWVMRPDLKHYDLWGTWSRMDVNRGECDTFRCVGGHVQQRQWGGEAADSFPLIGAYVTAYARDSMDLIIEKAGPGNVLYEDADSLHVTQKGLDALEKIRWIHPTNLGSLKVVAQTDFVRYFGPKNYQWGEDRVCAGVPEGAEVGEDGMISYERTESIRVTINNEPPPGPVVLQSRIKAPDPQIDGRVDEFGWVAWPSLGR